MDIAQVNGSVSAWGPAFRDSVDVAVDVDGSIAVVDRLDHSVSRFSITGVLEDKWGSGTPGNLDGRAVTAQFNEPVGIAFLGKSAVVSSFGGRDSGHVSIVTSVKFGSQYMKACDDMYTAQGYVHPTTRRRDGDALRVELRGDQSFTQAAALAHGATQFFQKLCDSRGAVLSRTTQGPEGTPCSRTVAAMRESVANIMTVKSNLEVMCENIEEVKFRPFVDESPVEHSFGEWDRGSQSRHPSLREYGGRKGVNQLNTIRKLTTTPHSYVTNKWSQYQTAHRSAICTEEVMRVLQDATPSVAQSIAPLTPQVKEKLLEEQALVRKVVALASQQRSQNERTKYARPTGVAPSTPIKLTVESGEGSDNLTGNQYVSYKVAVLRVGGLVERRTGAELRIGGVYSRDEYVFVPRDIIFCKAGEEADGTAAQDAWWPALVREAFHRGRQRARCQVKVFILDSSPHSPRSYQLNATPVTVRFESLLRGAGGKPMCILAEDTSSASCYSDGIVRYELDEDICHMADELTGVWEATGGALEVGGQSDSDDDGDARTAHRVMAQETVRTVMSTTQSGREAANKRQYVNYRQMNSGTTKTRRQPTQRQRRIGEEGSYETCGKCRRLGDLLMCDNTDTCREAFHLECIGLSEVPEGRWFCPHCTSAGGCSGESS